MLVQELPYTNVIKLLSLLSHVSFMTPEVQKQSPLSLMNMTPAL